MRSIRGNHKRLGLVVLAIATVVPLARPSRANAPAGRYTFPSTGTVFDTKTALTWQQKAPAATASQGSAESICFNNPMQLAGTGWRVPTVKELLTLVDVAHGGGLDTAAFPSQPLSSYWSTTPVVGQPGLGWVVTFGPGNNLNTMLDVSTLANVRCVR